MSKPVGRINDLIWMWIDTQADMHYGRAMRIKRTYTLSPAAVATVKRLVEVDHVAVTQDALVEQAIAELDRAVHAAYEAQRWSEAALDAEFQRELAEIAKDLPL